MGDVNGDGFGDVIVVSKSLTPLHDDKYVVFLGRADGLSSEPTWSADTDGSSPLDIAKLSDVNGDGRRDILLAHSLYLAPENLPPGPFFGAEPDLVFAGVLGATGDVNRDGCDDFVTARDGTATLHLGGEPTLD